MGVSVPWAKAKATKARLETREGKRRGGGGGGVGRKRVRENQSPKGKRWSPGTLALLSYL